MFYLDRCPSLDCATLSRLNSKLFLNLLSIATIFDAVAVLTRHDQEKIPLEVYISQSGGSSLYRRHRPCGKRYHGFSAVPLAG